MSDSPEENARLNARVTAYAERMLEHVRRNLSEAAKTRVGASAVAQSAWESVLRDDRRRGEAFGATTPGGIWEVVRDAALRHCGKHNKRVVRHPTPSLD